jgi:hypothetical protein
MKTESSRLAKREAAPGKNRNHRRFLIDSAVAKFPDFPAASISPDWTTIGSCCLLLKSKL